MSKSGAKLYRSEKFLSSMPAEWDVGPLDRVLTSIDAGRSPDLPDRPAQADEWGVLKVSAIRPDGLRETENKIVTRPSLIDPNIEVKNGDLLISRANTPELVGLACYVRKPRPGLMLSDKTLRLNLDLKLALPEFLNYLLQAPFSRREIEASGTGSSGSMKNISQDEIRSLVLPLPGIQEQFRLAEILGTADEAIESTERIIAKLERTRLGLLHDLLHRGIDGNGNSWLWLALSACVSSPITYGIVQAGPHVEGGVPYIRTGDMSGGRLEREGLLCTSRQIASSFARSRVRKGEIVCSIRATVGKVLSVPEELDGANLSQGTARISPASDIDPTYLLWALRGEAAQRQFGRAVKGTTFSEITLSQLRDIEIPIPRTITEQRRIAMRMSAADDDIAHEVSYLSKLRLMRRGLIHDLLTGQVRVGAEG